jgi:hypothetical protein
LVCFAVKPTALRFDENLRIERALSLKMAIKSTPDSAADHPPVP